METDQVLSKFCAVCGAFRDDDVNAPSEKDQVYPSHCFYGPHIYYIHLLDEDNA